MKHVKTCVVVILIMLVQSVLTVYLADMLRTLAGANFVDKKTDQTAAQYRAGGYLHDEGMKVILSDLQYFPIPESVLTPEAVVSYENSWMYERSFGRKRGHEGCDIMAGINERGFYPVVSMSAGVVEKIGWLRQGGYRLGIRSPNGGYFYYAHLYSYAAGIEEGSQVTAGELIGYMGDSGYSDTVGTVGNFDVHLHIGFYIQSADQEEISLNPYPFLQELERKKLKYVY